MRGWILRLWSLAITALAQNTFGQSSRPVDHFVPVFTADDLHICSDPISAGVEPDASANLTSEWLCILKSPPVYAEMLQTDSQAFQVLAPSNDAISDYLRLSGLPDNDTSAIFEAWATYHILRGTHSKNKLQSATQFIPTLLTDPDYNNITGGQRVEVQSAGEQVYFLSGNKSRSNIVQGV